MRIGELAEQVGTSTRTLRYYEQRGLLRARRTSSGYRDYDQEDARLVREIRALLGIGFDLEETRPFVECLQAGHDTGDECPASVAVYRRKLDELDACIDRMQSVRAHLAAQLDHTERAHSRAAEAAATLPAPPEPLCALTQGPHPIAPPAARPNAKETR
ncbi:MerR family transcriptional regulator [Streptomyces sp. SID3343]|uniref:MerR family transcriptional regulator n=1 Tax=Streptomyces sp. SID3343 TaxID=2690260 RepID=UPI00136DBF49|nr:MerR family transcriptional regulator [Streptomyces sp. SID3343]MYW06552.1 MerR family transcriptional regulator [Streptomyces sp. SID3343]